MSEIDFSRLYRKIQQSGIKNTIRSGWEIIYRDIILKNYYLEYNEMSSPWDVVSRDKLDDVSNEFWDINIGDQFQDKIPVRDSISKQENFDDVVTRQIAHPRVYEFHRGWLLGPSGLGFTQNSLPISDTVGLPPADRRRIAMSLAISANEYGFQWVNNQIKQEVNQRNYSSKQSVITAIIPLWNNYYHWLIECLPRLRYIQEYKKITGRDPVVFIPASRTSWMDDALCSLGADLNYQELTGKNIYTDRLVVPPYPDPSLDDILWLQSKFLNKQRCESTPNHIYITRDDATSRRVKNKGEVNAILANNDIVKYTLSECSVQKQADVFAGADLIIAPHGAGLANIVFCDRETSIIELFGDNKKTSYYRISKIMDLKYSHISGESDGTDIIVDVDELRTVINSFFY